MSENFSKTEQDAWVSWVRCSQHVMGCVEQALKDGGFPTLAWYDALLELDFSPGGKLRFSELGERMLLKKFNVTRLIDRLEKQGLVEREACDSDARGAYAVITAEGKKLRRAIWPCYRDAVREHFLKNMTEKEMTALTKLLKIMSR
ncbi:MAG: MarR family winged helix-turn-helix transcriptional regulator [Pseudomonadota bacterium]